MKAYRKTEKAIAVARKYKLAYRANPDNKDKLCARSAVRHAIKAGGLTKSPCEHCGHHKSEAHHWSYLPEHHLDVIWLCRSCHIKEHVKIRETNNLERKSS